MFIDVDGLKEVTTRRDIGRATSCSSAAQGLTSVSETYWPADRRRESQSSTVDGGFIQMRQPAPSRGDRRINVTACGITAAMSTARQDCDDGDMTMEALMARADTASTKRSGNGGNGGTRKTKAEPG